MVVSIVESPTDTDNQSINRRTGRPFQQSPVRSSLLETPWDTLTTLNSTFNLGRYFHEQQAANLFSSDPVGGTGQDSDDEDEQYGNSRAGGFLSPTASLAESPTASRFYQTTPTTAGDSWPPSKRNPHSTRKHTGLEALHESMSTSGDSSPDESPEREPPSLPNEHSTHGSHRRHQLPLQESVKLDLNGDDDSQYHGSHARNIAGDVRHDPVWMSVFWLCFAAIFATSFMVYLNTEAPDRRNPIGDTIYNTIHHSYKMLRTATILSAGMAVGWLTLVRLYASHVLWTVIVSVPVILFSFFLYGFSSSLSSPSLEQGFQDQVLCVISFVPLVLSIVWTIVVARTWHSLDRALRIIDFSLERLNDYPQLVWVGLASLGASVVWTWVWITMFARVFLGGHFSFQERTFLIDTSSWWLGLFFVIMYMWTNGVIAGIQRVTTAGTISSWFDNQLSTPDQSPGKTVTEALIHALDVQFGTIALSALLNIILRLPVMILPQRLGSILTYVVSCLVSKNVAMLTSPLTLTYAAIHSYTLEVAARQIQFLKPVIPSLVDGDTGSGYGNSGRLEPIFEFTPFRLAKFLLRGSRYVMCISTGLVVWVTASRSLVTEIPPVTVVRGSMYAYIVGIVAASISWCIFGSMESVLGSVIDALLVFWGDDATSTEPVRRQYTSEANALFSEEAGHSWVENRSQV